MEVFLLDHTKLSNAVIASRTAYQSFDKGGNYAFATDDLLEVDKQFINKLVNVLKHESVIEQVVYNFSMNDFSRAVLQQWSRSRIISQTVMSTRYVKPDNFKLYKTGIKEFDDHVENYFKDTLEKFKDLPNDILKYAYPESLLTKNVVQLNARELMHIFDLRLSKNAFKEYQDLCKSILKALPEKHLFLYEKYLDKL